MNDRSTEATHRDEAGAPPAPGRKRHHHGDLRAALIEAAIAHVRENGAATFSLRDATSGAGVTSGAAYRHFRSRDAVLDEVVVYGFALLSRAMHGATEPTRVDAVATTEGGSVDRLIATGLAYIRFAREEPHLFALMFSPEGANGRARSFETDFGVPNASDQLRHALTDLGATDETTYLRAWGLAHGLAALAAAGIGGSDADHAAAVQAFARTLPAR